MASSPETSTIREQEREREPTLSALGLAVQTDVERELKRERNEAELLYNRIFFWAVVVGTVLFLVDTSPPWGRLPLTVRLFCLCIFLGELGWCRFVRSRILLGLAAGLGPPFWPRAVSSGIELLFATGPLLVVGLSYDGAHALDTPAPWSYFLFVVLSTLRMDHRLSRLTGIFAAAQYLSLCLLLGPRTTGLRPDWWPLQAGKACVLMIGGFAAGYIAHYLGRQIGTMVDRLQREQRLRALFGQHVSKAVLGAIVSADLGAQSGTRKVCVMFLDLRGFTTFSEGKAPEEVVRYLNTLFAFMVEVVDRRHGVVNKFLGDGFMAVFGAPIPSENPCLEALEAGREIVARVGELAASRAIPPTSAGIGIHFGEAMTGFVGTETRREYTVIGDVVNVASRVESLNKEFGSSLLVSEEVLQALPAKPPEAVSKGPVQVKGRKQPVIVWQLG